MGDLFYYLGLKDNEILPDGCLLLYIGYLLKYSTFAHNLISNAMAEKTRYTDEELEEFREIILTKLEKAKKDYEILKSSITHEESNDTMDTSPTFKVLEEGATTLSKEEAGRLAQRQLKFIQHLQAALVRIENKTYGICRETGKLIAKERLRAVPHATLCIDAKMKQK
jgi:DnaK suppressor protein